MRQSFVVLWIVALMAVTGCGGRKKVATGETLSLTPTSVSLEPGQVAQLTAQTLSATGIAIVGDTYTFSSDNSALADVSINGLLCAGKWDSDKTPVVCTPATAEGTANITAKNNTGLVSNSVPVTIHLQHVTNVTITTTGTAACTSQGTTQQYAAKAFDSSGNEITASVGTPTWHFGDSAIGSVDANGLVTAAQPGATTIYATLDNVNSLPLTFTTCPPVSISISTTGSSPAETSYTLSTGASKAITATAVDANGVNLVNLVLTYSSSEPLSVGVGGSLMTATVSALTPGSAGIIASCTPPNCDSGLGPVYSNLISAQVSGSSAATTVYATGSGATTIVPIDTGTNVEGTALSIPTIGGAAPSPNSFLINKQGTTGYIGTNLGLVTLDLATGAFTANSQTPGKVLALSHDGGTAIVSNIATGTVYFVSGTSFATQSVANALAASFSPDGSIAYITQGNSFTSSSASVNSHSGTFTATASDVNIIDQGSLTFYAGGAPGAIDVRATCDGSDLTALSLGGAALPVKITSLWNSAHVYAVDTGGNIDDVSVTLGAQGCPPAAPALTVQTTALGVGAFTPNQLFAAPNSKALIATGASGKLPLYDPSTGLITDVMLSSGTVTTTGGTPNDGSNFYVGVQGSNDVHRIDLTAKTDAQAIAVNLKDSSGNAVSPDFVAVRPK